MGSQDEFRRRKRRRKTKSERDKTRTSSSQSEVDVKQDVSRHLKTARHISYPLRSLGAVAGDNSSSISQSRLTRRLGLYNQSKTSRKIIREPIIVPESVRKKTEEDLKKILDLTEKMPSLQMEIEMDAPSPTVCTVEKNKPTCKSSTGVVHDVSSAGLNLPSASRDGTPTGPQVNSANTKHSIKSTASAGASLTDMDEEVTEEDNFPSSPPMEEIAEYLCGELDDQTMFTDRDLVQEICSELIKNFKIISPHCATPTTKPNEKLVTAGSIRRVLVDSFSNSPNKENTDLVQTAEIIISKNLSTSEARCSVQIRGDQKSIYLRESKPGSGKKHFCRSLVFNETCTNTVDSKDNVRLKEKDIRQECADALILLGKPHQSTRENVQMVEVMCKEVDAKSVLSSVNPSRKDLNTVIEKDSRSSPDALALLVQNDRNEAKQAELRCSHSSKDRCLMYHRNYKFPENELNRGTLLKLSDSGLYYQNKKKASDMSRLYNSNCNEQTVSGKCSQVSGLYKYPQMSSNGVPSFNQLLKCDRPLERCVFRDEHSVVVPKGHKSVHQPLESHRQNLALAIQSAARPWAKDVSLSERKTAVVTEYQQHPEFMPRFHGDFYKDALLFQDDVWPDGDKTSDHSLIADTEIGENMDILDYLDHSQGSQTDPIHDSLQRHGKVHYSRKLLQPGSPDSDGSPTWIAPEASLRAWKPKLESPESPHKLYPRRLY